MLRSRLSPSNSSRTLAVFSSSWIERSASSLFVEIPRSFPVPQKRNSSESRIAVFPLMFGARITFAGAYIWGKECILLYVPPAPGLFVPMAGATFIWSNAGLTTTIDKVSDDMHKSDVLQGDQAMIHTVTGSDLGYRLKTAVA